MRRVLLLAGALLLSACQQTPVASKPASAALSPAEELRLEGDAFLAKGDYANAAEKYRQAVDLEPGAVPPHFALGTAYSFLDKRPEAVVQFRWVLANADPSSKEYEESHAWLTRVGVLIAPSTAPAESARRDEKQAVDPSAVGRLVGRTEWPEISPKTRLITGTMSLIGDEPVTHDIKRSRAFRLGDGYEFKDVPPGRYRVVALIDGATVWDEKVTVEAGKDNHLILSQATSPVPAGKFTPPQPTAHPTASR